MKNILLLSATASAINCIRSLTRRPDVRLFVTDANRHASGLYLPGVTPIVVPPARNLTEYRRALDEIIGTHRIDALIPSSDHDIAAVMKLLHSGWGPNCALFRPPYEAFRILSDKARLAAFLRGKVAYVPRSFREAEVDEFPVVVKPVSEGGSKGVEFATSRSQVAHAAAAIRTRFGGDVAIQEYIPGDVGSIHMVVLLYGASGEYLMGVPMQSHLTFMTWGGGGNAGVIVDEPILVEQSREIIALAGGWRGPINVEFKRHQANGRFYLMEANCRLNGYSYLTTMNGMDFPSAIVSILAGEQPASLVCPPASERSNFILGFRELLVSEWCC